MTVSAIERLEQESIDYSICTLVNDGQEYERMLQSFARNGFKAPRCEYLHIDNTQINKFDGFSGLNVFLRAARGRYVIVCHQDVELLDDGIQQLDQRLDELSAVDPAWGLAGNAGGRYKGDVRDLAIRISDPYGRDTAKGPFPCRVSALDENFLVIKASANLAASGDLKGFHLYALDLAVLAAVLGYRAYVIDFHLQHASPGRLRSGGGLARGEVEFQVVRRRLIDKYKIAFAPRWYSSSAAEVLLRPKPFLDFGYNCREAIKVAAYTTRIFLSRWRATLHKWC
jgi:hypothetical protein